ncbi:Uncharacterised protein [uncultured archaeon]|nr:Uncharacterised protein [uncultured archaeon]
MTLASNYLDYAGKLADFLKNPSDLNHNSLELSAKNVQESWYGVSIDPPKVLDGLEETLNLLFAGNKSKWDGLLYSLTTGSIVSLGRNAVAPVYHRLVSIREKFS